MNKYRYCVLVTVLAGGMAFGEEAKKDDPAPVTQLTLYGAAEPKEALKYQLLVGLLDQTRGNAALHYSRAMNLFPDGEGVRERLKEWLEMPVDQLPGEEVFLTYQNSLHNVDLASRCGTCDWQRHHEDGYGMLLPRLGDLRSLARVLGLRIRLAIAAGEFDKAIELLQKGFVMARHIAEGPTLVEGMVGISIANLMLNEVETLVQRPDSGNMYWALTDLPQPFVDVRQSTQYERDTLFFAFPQLRDVESAKLTAAEAVAMVDEFMGMIGELTGSWNSKGRLVSTGWVMMHYSDAKKFLAEQGRTAAEIEAMPAGQAVLIYQLQEYKQIRDDLFKWFSVPYHQAREHLEKHDKQLRQESEKGVRGNMFVSLLPGLSRAYLLSAKLDRQIAMLRCVEAVRMYAAGHEGKLPGSLGDITAVPIPLDPVTGESFIYEVVDGKARFEAPVAAAEKAERRPRYELVMKR